MATALQHHPTAAAAAATWKTLAPCKSICGMQRPLSRRSRTTFLGWSAAPLDPFYLAARLFSCSAAFLLSSIFCGSLLSVTISSAALCYVSRSTGQSIILQCKKFVYHCCTTHIKCRTKMYQIEEKN